jgi:hypothetical protein
MAAVLLLAAPLVAAEDTPEQARLKAAKRLRTP